MIFGRVSWLKIVLHLNNNTNTWAIIVVMTMMRRTMFDDADYWKDDWVCRWWWWGRWCLWDLQEHHECWPLHYMNLFIRVLTFLLNFIWAVRGRSGSFGIWCLVFSMDSLLSFSSRLWARESQNQYHGSGERMKSMLLTAYSLWLWKNVHPLRLEIWYIARRLRRI